MLCIVMEDWIKTVIYIKMDIMRDKLILEENYKRQIHYRLLRLNFNIILLMEQEEIFTLRITDFKKFGL